ncbi:MAG TPA: hypothetical protein VKV38_17680, partial [Trebonia sp.]|nr:hypothetical protein [Trebonia sp.]
DGTGNDGTDNDGMGNARTRLPARGHRNAAPRRLDRIEAAPARAARRCPVSEKPRASTAHPSSPS